jgi:crotonobetainyl-CoA:carnitine CoA-transferase CaiB-like acyl-CoA transferase
VALGLPALADDPRYATNGDRVDRRSELRPTLAERFLERTTAEWLASLEAADIPAGPINDILAAFAAPEAIARSMTVELDHPAWGVIRQVGVPFELSATPASIRVPPPLLGADTDAILTQAGYDTAGIQALRDAQVV